MFAALIGPSRYLVPIPPWRLVLGSFYATALLTMQAFAVLITLDEARLVSLPDSELVGWTLFLATVLVIAAELCAGCWHGERLVVLRRLASCVGTGARRCTCSS